MLNLGVFFFFRVEFLKRKLNNIVEITFFCQVHVFLFFIFFPLGLVLLVFN